MASNFLTKLFLSRKTDFLRLKKGLIISFAHRLFFFAAIFLFFAPQSFAERIGFKDKGDLCIDLPEDYLVSGSNADGTAYQIDYALAPVTLVIRIYEEGRFKSAKEALEATLSNLKASSATHEVPWRNLTGATGEFNFLFNQVKMEGKAMASLIPNEKGCIVCAAWCPANQKEKCEPFITSFLDGVYIDSGSYFEGGIWTSYKFPQTNEWQEVNLSIDGKTISSKIRTNDKEASEYVIEREYQTLLVYKSSSKWKEAWQRYYRMIYRDSFHRLQKVSFDIYNALAPNCKDGTDLAQKLLSWTQTFSYEREKNSSDFASLPSMLLGGGSDCDSRSMLLSVLLTSMNQDAIMLVSRQYSHALCAITSGHQGHSFKFSGKDYLMGETTKQGLTWGIIAADQDDQSKWIPVMFP